MAIFPLFWLKFRKTPSAIAHLAIAIPHPPQHADRLIGTLRGYGS
ncbi:MAG: hypothetical protein VKK04_14490 [Synechococcales bacterium]|nr:hypothetical protein [Synechococcales bacterium]